MNTVCLVDVERISWWEWISAFLMGCTVGVHRASVVCLLCRLTVIHVTYLWFPFYLLFFAFLCFSPYFITFVLLYSCWKWYSFIQEQTCSLNMPLILVREAWQIFEYKTGDIFWAFPIMTRSYSITDGAYGMPVKSSQSQCCWVSVTPSFALNFCFVLF